MRSSEKLHKTRGRKKFDNFHFLSARAPAFEGFYCKSAKSDGTTLVVICGYVKSGQHSHAFIQVSTQDSETCYFEYPIDQLKVSDEEFNFSINGHCFSKEGISINEKDCVINIKFEKFTAWKRSFFKPTVMGLLSYIPFVECKHDVTAPSLTISGKAQVGNNEVNFKNASGYIDKNWGASFPEKYFWGHVAGFSDSSISIQFAKGCPKWLLWKVPVYIGFLRIDGKTHTFSSVKSGKLTMINVGHREISLENSKYRIILKFNGGTALNLKAPLNGKLDDEIVEHAGINTLVQIYEKSSFRKNRLVIKENVHDSTLEVKNYF